MCCHVRVAFQAFIYEDACQEFKITYFVCEIYGDKFCVVFVACGCSVWCLIYVNIVFNIPHIIMYGIRLSSPLGTDKLSVPSGVAWLSAITKRRRYRGLVFGTLSSQFIQSICRCAMCIHHISSHKCGKKILSRDNFNLESGMIYPGSPSLHSNRTITL